MSLRLEGKVALLTGVASGIGRETALTFAREGARIAGCDLNAEGGRETLYRIEQAGGEAVFIRADVSQEDQVAAMVAQAVTRYGKLDVLCNIAGIGPPSDAAAVDLEWSVFEQVLRVNVGSVFLCSKHGLPHLIRNGQGSIVNIASIAGLVGAITAPVTAYGTSKAAVIGLSRQLACQVAQYHVRVNAICPGPIDTPILAPFMTDPSLRKRYAERTPLGRMGTPDDVANLCLYLASDESRHMTGAVLVIDGGITAL